MLYIISYILGKKSAEGGGGDVTVEELNVTENGTVTAPSGKAYSPVTVNVPNSYSVSDEGKVVSNGALVAQTAHAEVTQNGTVDTTLNNSVTVNVSSGVGNEDKLLSATFNGETITSNITKLGYLFQKSSGPVYVVLPELTTMSGMSLCLQTSIVKFFAPKAVISAGDVFKSSVNLTHAVINYITSYTTFGGCTNLEAVDIQSSSGKLDNLFQTNCGKMATLVLRGNAVATLQNITNFAGSPFKSDGTGGTVYVPSALISSYQSASNWSTILGYANNQIKSIESTHTDPNAPIDLTLYYADGTPIPTT